MAGCQEENRDANIEERQRKNRKLSEAVSAHVIVLVTSTTCPCPTHPRRSLGVRKRDAWIAFQERGGNDDRNDCGYMRPRKMLGGHPPKVRLQ